MSLLLLTLWTHTHTQNKISTTIPVKGANITPTTSLSVLEVVFDVKAWFKLALKIVLEHILSCGTC